MADFEQEVGRTLEIEGGFSEDSKDPGNWTGGAVGVGELRGTKCGISAAAYPEEDIGALTIERVKFLMKRDYWDTNRLDEIRDPNVAREVFDTGINMGVKTSAEILQGSLILLGRDIALDGTVGDETVHAANSCPYPKELLKLMNVMQGSLYLVGTANVPTLIEMVRKRKEKLRRYVRGWLRRVEI